MKHVLFHLALMAIMPFLFTISVQATMLDVEQPFAFSECEAYAPDVPDLPDEEDILYGDANDDGVINVLDIIAVVNYISGLNPDPFNFEAADMNNDGNVNVLDIIFETNVIMEVQGIPCPGEPTVNYEGQVYNTVRIGEQCWFKENLNIGEMIEGTIEQSNNGTIEKYCYNNEPDSCTKYGGLYQWNEAMQYVSVEGAQGICPVGWHVPADGEWKILEGTVDSQYPVGDPEWDETGQRGLDAGGNLKEAGIAHWLPPNIDATNESGFTGLPAGVLNYQDRNFYSLGYFGDFWTSSAFNSTSAFWRTLNRDNAYINRNYNEKETGRSVRCIKGGCTPPQADAGDDATTCDNATYFLSGATASNYAALLWTTSGTGSFNDPTLLNASYTPSTADIASEEVELTLTATGSGGCPNAESTMTLTIHGAPDSNAGTDAGICPTQTIFTLSGTAVNYSSILWTTSGTGTFSNPSSLSASYTLSTGDISAGQVMLTLTANGNGTCGQVSDPMILTLLPATTVANAGPDQLNITGTFTSLAGNTPIVGTGLWEIVAGTGGTIQSPASPTSEFQGITGNIYTLSWTITSVCGSTSDQVVISFAESFLCGEDLLYEAQSYATILIGTQCWMAENLNIGTMINNTAGGQLQTDNGIIEKYCYGNDAANCDIYGGMYEWSEAMQYVTTEGTQGICPADWHLPTNAELKILEGTVDSQYPVGDPIWDEWGYRGYDAGGNLKEAGLTHWNTPNTGATNSSGFTGLPGGNRLSQNGLFANLGYQGNFWSSSQYDAVSAYVRSLRYLNANIRQAVHYNYDGLSIRCLKDE